MRAVRCVWVLCALVVTVAASTFVPCCDLANLRNQIYNASNDGVIVLASGTFINDSSLPLTLGGPLRAVTIMGTMTGGVVSTTLRGSAVGVTLFQLLNETSADAVININIVGPGQGVSGRAIVANNTVLMLTNVSVSNFGTGGISISNGSIAVSGGTFSDISGGPGIRALATTVVITGATFTRIISSGSGVTAVGSGPTIYTVDISNSQFINNSLPANGAGAGLSLSVQQATIRRCTFLNNQVSGGTGSMGGTVQLSSGVTTMSDTTISGSIANCVPLSGGPRTGGIYVDATASLMVLNSVLSNNIGNEAGGILVVHYGQLTVDGTQFVNNTGTSYTNTFAILSGGAVTFIDGPATPVVVTNSYFRQNSGKSAGALDLQYPTMFCCPAALALFNCTFVANTALDASLSAGAVIVHSTTSVNVSRSVFHQNVGRTHGALGVIPVGPNTTLYVSDSIFNGSGSAFPANQGGGLHNEMPFAAIKNATFTGNSGYNGSALWSSAGGGSVLNITSSTFSANSAAYYGTVFIPQAASVLIAGCTFANNTAAIESAGIHYTWGGVFVVTGSVFIGNTIQCLAGSGSGGAIQINNVTASVGSANVTITSSTFRENSARQGGGAIYATMLRALNIAGCAFLGNKASPSLGGAVYAQLNYGVVWTVQQTNFVGNTAGNGGATYISGGNGVFVQTNVTNNYADTGGGGGINCQSICNLTDVVITSNSALTGSGGGVYGAAEMYILRAIMTGNRAPYGGAVVFGAAISTLTDSLISSNTAINYGGGIYVGGGANRLVISSSSVVNNLVTRPGAAWGAGIYGPQISGDNVLIQGNQYPCDPSSLGIGVYASVSLILTNSRVLNHSCSASSGAAGQGGGIFTAPGTTTAVRLENVTIADNRGADGAGAFLSTGSGLTLFSLKNVSFLRNNGSSGDGGGVYIHLIPAAPYLAKIDACTFIGNTVAGRGGAMRLVGQFAITNSVIASNFAGGVGGGVWQFGPGVNITFTNVMLSGNTAGTNGGGVSADGNVFAANVSLAGNTALTGNGGGIVASGAMTVQQSTVRDNSSPAGVAGGLLINSPSTISGTAFLNNNAAKGGAMYLLAPVSLADVAFTGNSVLLYGGAIYTATVNITCIKCNFTRNIATNPGANGQGGAVWMVSTLFFLDMNSTFTANTANQGGAVFANCGSLSGTSFTANSAREGGAVYLNGGSMSSDGASFLRNTASGEGGAIFINGADFRFNSPLFQANSASNGGALSVFPSGDVRVTNGRFLYNHAQLGGAVNVAASATINLAGPNTSFIGNDAFDSGGAVYVDVLATLFLYNATVTANHAGLGGAVCISFVASGTIGGCAFSSNYATSGGAVYASEASNMNLFLSGFANNSADAGGAVYTAATTTISGTGFFQNKAATTGAAIYSSGTLNMPSGVNIWNNTAGQAAAGISCQQCALTISGMSLSGNSAPAAPLLTCALGSSMTINTPGVQIGAGNSPVAGGDSQLLADCTHCGCCARPAETQAHINVAPCWPFARPDMTCDFSCDAGYGKASAMLTCASGATFSPSPSCQPLPCTIPGNLPTMSPHMVLTSRNGTYVTGQQATFACEYGYNFYKDGDNDVPPSEIEATCQAPTWSPLGNNCSLQYCAQPVIPTVGTLTITTASPYGSVNNITCPAGYHTLATGQVCTYAPGYVVGFWIPSELSCTPDQCAPAAILNAPGVPTLDYSEGNNTNAKAFYVCSEPGTALDPRNAYLICDGINWVPPPGQIPATCSALPCPELPPLINGNLSYTIAPTPQNLSRIPRRDDTVNAICNHGFAPVDLTLVQKTCIVPDGSNQPVWSNPQAFECAATTCNLVRDTTFISCENRSEIAVDSVCNLGCLPGSAGAQLFQSTCSQTADNAVATWQPAEPTCNPCDTTGFSAGNALVCQTCPGQGLTDGQGATLQSNCSCIPGTAEANPGTGDCGPCPTGAVCPGGRDEPISKAGYFKNNGQFVLCTPEEACKGGDNCTEGYTGFLCGGCDVHYYRLNGRCVACPNDIWWRILVAVVIALGLAYGLVVIVKPSAVSERSYGFASANIAVSFVQIVATFADLRVPWPAKTRELFQVFSTLNLNIELAGPECFATFTFWQKFQLQMSIPLIAAGLLAVLWVGWVVAAWIYAKHPPWKLFKRTVISIGKVFVGAYLFFLMVAYLLLAKAALSVFACRKHPDGQYTIAEATAEFCFKDQWGPNAVIGGIGIAVYVVGIPFIMEFVYYRIRAKYGSHVAVRSLYANFLVKKFTNERWYWEAIIMLRKLTVVLVATLFFGDPYIQVALCSGVFFLVCIATLVLKPYRWTKHNLLEIVSLVGSLVVLFCGQMSASPLYGPIQQEVIGGVAIFTVTVCLLLFAICFALEAGIFLTIQRLQKKLNADGVLKVPSTTSAPVAVLIDTTRDHVIVVGQDGVVRGHEIKDVNPVIAFDVSHKVRAAAMYGSHLAVTNGDSVELWDLDTRQCVAAGSSGHNSPINVLAASPRGLATGHDTGGVGLWAFNTPVALRDSKAVGTSSQFGSLSAADLTLMLDDDDGGGTASSGAAAMPSMTAASGKLLLITDVRYCEGHNRSVTCVCITSWFVYSASTDARVKKWNALEGQQLREWTVTGLQEPTAIEENGTHLVVGDVSGTLFLIDVAGLEVTRSIRAQTARITRLVARGGSFASSSVDGSVVLWDSKDGGYQQTLAQEQTAACGVALVRDGSRDLALWADSLGVLRQKDIHVAWHVRDFDPQLATRVWNNFKTRVLGMSRASTGSGKGDENDALLYEELHVISRDLGVIKGAAANNADQWVQLGRDGALSLTEALVEQSAERDGRASRKL